MTASANEYTFYRAPYRRTTFRQIDEIITLNLLGFFGFVSTEYRRDDVIRDMDIFVRESPFPIPMCILYLC